jgi:hypothetical protein
MTDRPLAATSAADGAVSSNLCQAHNVNGRFGSLEIKKRRMPTDFFSCCDWPHMRATVRRKKPAMKLRLNIKCL